MRSATAGLLALFVVLGGLGAARAGGAPADHRERVAPLRALEVRRGPASVPLPASASVVEVGPAVGFVVGADARSFMRLTQGVDYPRVEAVVIGGSRGFVFVEWFDSGYVATADWHRLDPARLMARIRRETADANARRRAAAVDGIEVVGWEEPPRLIGRGDGVRWAIRAVEGGETTVNATVLKLGRRGYQKLTWVGAETAHAVPGALLDEVMAGHRFRAGHGHADHASGDPVAPFGIAALVTGAAGAAPERGGGAAVAAVLPKAWPVALLAALLGVCAVRLGRRGFLFAAAPGRHKLSRHDRRDP